VSESTKKHKEHAPKSLTFAIVTVSTSRYQQLKRGQKVDDVSGDLAESLLKKAGHRIMLRKIISDDRAMIEECVCSALFTEGLDATIFCGGTGIAPSDMTIETVSPFLEKALHGFGEIFRRLSFDQIGSAALMSRAIAGVAKGKVVFCIPGSPDAVRLCVERLILPEAAHIVKHARE
jgi:molybdenum cofactor biosynthesis protein B